MAPSAPTNELKGRKALSRRPLSALRTVAVLSTLFAPDQVSSFGGASRTFARRTALSAVSTMPDAMDGTTSSSSEPPRRPTPVTSPIVDTSTAASDVTASSSQTDHLPVDAAMLSTYDDLARRCVDRLARDAASGALRNGQLFVGVGGGPGSGKSSLSEAVAARVDALLGETGRAKVLPMDGFHYSRDELRSIASAEAEKKGTENGSTTTYDDLLARRGAPWTFDAEGCFAAFSAAREAGQASLPVYSRATSDPVPDGVTLDATTSVVLLEGNYLLSWDDPKWAPLREVFDETWYVACGSMQEQRERLIGRHLETWTEEKANMWGEGREGAAKKADANDVLNAEWIDVKSRHHADLIVESK